MSKLNYKYKDQENPGFYWYIPENAFIVSPRAVGFNVCEEYDIIQKIERNEEGFFDFNKNLIDVGAEDGNYSILLDFSHNYCFEPNKDACCLIYTNMYLRNKVEITDVYNVGLGAEDGIIRFNGFSCEDNTNVGKEKFQHDIQHLKATPYNIPIKKLDSYGVENVGLIKVDVEGFEENVLRGGVITIIKNNYPPILFELWDVGYCMMTQEKHDSLSKFLTDLGYEIHWYWGDHETHLAIHK